MKLYYDHFIVVILRFTVNCTIVFFFNILLLHKVNMYVHIYLETKYNNWYTVKITYLFKILV